VHSLAFRHPDVEVGAEAWEVVRWETSTQR